MPNTKPKTSATARPSSYPAPRRRRTPLIIFGLIVLLVCGAFYGLHARQQSALRADKARFVQAEQDVDALSRAIIAATGEPLKVTNQKFCSRPSVEIGKGPLSCNVEILHFYAVNDESQATVLFKKVSTVAQGTWQRTGIKSSSNMNRQNFNPINLENYSRQTDYQRVIEDYVVSGAEMQCSIVHTFYKTIDPPSSDYLNVSVSPFLVMNRIDCGQSALAQHYPMDH